MFLGVFALSVGYYILHGKKFYLGPVTSVAGRREDGGGGPLFQGNGNGNGIGMH